MSEKTVGEVQLATEAELSPSQEPQKYLTPKSAAKYIVSSSEAVLVNILQDEKLTPSQIERIMSGYRNGIEAKLQIEDD